MAKDRIKLTLNDKALNAQLKRAMLRNPIETTRAARECLIDLASESARRAPIESGDLRNDCRAELNGSTIFENQSLTGAAFPSLRTFGTVGYSLPYALRQHEELSYSHNRTDGYRRKDGSTVNMVAGGEAKFLEKPFNERKGRYIQRISQIPQKVIK